MASSSSNTNQDLHLWSTTPDINLWPAMIARDRKANRIEKIVPHARVMSPNDEFRESIFDVTQVYCQVCDTVVSCLYVCAGCGAYGHTQCLHLEKFFDYLFCPPCFLKAVAEYASFQDAQRREAWRNSLALQLIRWRSRVTEAVGMSSTIGVAMGGAVVAVAGVAAGLAHGVVRGAAVGSNIFQLALSPMNDDQASTAYLSAGDPSEVPSAHAGRLLDETGEER